MLGEYLQSNPEHEKLKKPITRKSDFRQLFFRKQGDSDDSEQFETNTQNVLENIKTNNIKISKNKEYLTHVENRFPGGSQGCLKKKPKAFQLNLNLGKNKPARNMISGELSNGIVGEQSSIQTALIFKTKFSTYDSNKMKPTKPFTKKTVVFALEKMSKYAKKKKNEPENFGFGCLCCF